MNRSIPIVAGSCPTPYETWGFYGAEDFDVVFWDVTPCSLVDGYQRDGETYCLHSEGFTVQKTTNYIMNQFSAVPKLTTYF
jgi:hypothetical protein